MKKTWQLFGTILLAISLLAACNTKDESNGAESETNTNIKTDETTDTPETEEAQEEVAEEVEDETEEQAVSSERGPQKTLNYSVNDETKEESSTLINSDEQNYSIYKLDGYSLTGEEPNKDALTYDENSAVFMRVETISKDDADYEIIANNMIESIAAVTIGQEPVKIVNKEQLPQGEGISKQIGYEAKFELGTVSGIVFEQGNLIVRLTIFDQNSVNLTDAFLKMGETIGAK
ncbi:hypothetical protein [Paenisporosarcina indica]|uniref:hypothetical protein n=1 Tax=Paenisporosarcina indica TaxID=650093 RepID=UPI00094F4EB9|nr:hypothetical protein [Paenisporosarcina indica]